MSQEVVLKEGLGSKLPDTGIKPPKASQEIVLTAGAKKVFEALVSAEALNGPVPASAVDDLVKYRQELVDAGAIIVEGQKRGAKYRVAAGIKISDKTAPERIIKTRAPRGSKTGSKGEGVSKSTRGPLPSPEALLRLVKAIQDEERKVLDTASAENDKEITRLKKEIATASGDRLTLVFQELSKAMEERKTLTATVRQEAFKNVEASGIPEAIFLKHLSPTYD